MVPVLAVKDPGVATRMLTENFGFRPLPGNHLAFGDQEICVSSTGAPPSGMTALPLDHVAFQVPDADAAFRRFAAKGARLCAKFTPVGPRDILEFCEDGVRFVFFEGPEGWPFEFCARIGVLDSPEGHGHFAIRTRNLDIAQEALEAQGATLLAKHMLGSSATPIDVRFVAQNTDIFELFDEEPVSDIKLEAGWIGLLDDRMQQG